MHVLNTVTQLDRVDHGYQLGPDCDTCWFGANCWASKWPTILERFYFILLQFRIKIRFFLAEQMASTTVKWEF